MNKRRVVVTGIGTFAPFGKSTPEAFENLMASKGSIKQLPDELSKATGINFASYFDDYQGSDFFSKKELRSYDLVSQYAIIAAIEAAKQANLNMLCDRNMIGCNVTSGIGGLNTIEAEIVKATSSGFNKISPMFIPKSIINLVAGNVAIKQDAKGICNSLVSACASSTDAVGHAAMYIENGLADVMITGGSEATINKTALAGFANIGALNKTDQLDEASIPFDERRKGFVMGEGACVLVLEEYEHAKKRNAKIYAEICGYGASCDASHITAPDATGCGAQRAIQLALKDNDPKQISYVNAHGTSTPLNDQIEALVYQKLFDRPLVTSTKGLTGHMLGAAGATELMVTIMSLQTNQATIMKNSTMIDQNFKLNFATATNNVIEDGYGLSVSLGFGGHNAAVLVKRGADEIK